MDEAISGTRQIGSSPSAPRDASMKAVIRGAGDRAPKAWLEAVWPRFRDWVETRAGLVRDLARLRPRTDGGRWLALAQLALQRPDARLLRAGTARARPADRPGIGAASPRFGAPTPSCCRGRRDGPLPSARPARRTRLVTGSSCGLSVDAIRFLEGPVSP